MLRNNIQSARAGEHVTLSNTYTVEHRGDRTFCIPVPEDMRVRWEPESGRGEGLQLYWPGLITAKERWLAAMDLFAPRKPDPTL